jgi:uncharacterized protein
MVSRSSIKTILERTMKAAPAAPLVIGVIELLRRLGTRRDVDAHAELDGLALSTSRVPEGEEVHVKVTLEAIAQSSLTATGTVTAAWEGECRRCLAPVRGTLTAKVKDVFETSPVEGETYALLGDHVDLEPMVRDVVLLHLPLAPLCSDGCAGPVPDVLPVVVADDEEGTPDSPVDPRWSALEGLRFD